MTSSFLKNSLLLVAIILTGCSTVGQYNNQSQPIEQVANRAEIEQEVSQFSQIIDQEIKRGNLNEEEQADDVNYLKSLPAHLKNEQRLAIVRAAVTQIGTPYKTGGEAPGGFDCSGLAMYAYAKNGIEIPHQSASLYQNFAHISLVDAHPGDLIFFSNSVKKLKKNHIGIYLGQGYMVHAPQIGQKVRVTSVYKKYWQDHYVSALRILPA